MKTKLTSEELQEFKKVEEEYQRTIFDLGLTTISIAEESKKLADLENEKIELLITIGQIIIRKQEISRKLGDKYGERQVDLETGELK